ncbi:MAG: ATP-binding protein [Pseudomonadales bacterium]|nr:ATP-binding protein [Pseudomonadales bacterium]
MISLTATSVCASNLDVGDSGHLNKLVTAKFQYLEDGGKQLTIHHILEQSSQYEWQSISRDSISFGFTSSAYWLTTTVSNSSKNTKRVLIDLAYPKVSTVQLYWVSLSSGDARIVSEHIIKATDPVRKRMISHRHPVFPVELKPGEIRTLYLRLENKFALAIPIKLWEEDSFSRNDKQYMLFQGCYFGCMFAMLIYNFFIFFTTRDQSFLYYVLFVASLIFFSVVDRGFGGEYLWNNNEDLNYRFYVAFIAVAISLATAFGRVYLSVREYSVQLSKSLRVSELVGWSLAIWALIAPSFNLILAMVITMGIAGSLVIASAFYVLKQGLDIAKFYLLAWLVIIIGGFTHIAGNFGIIPFSTLTEHMLQISNIVEAMLLSFGLGFRINLLKSETESANILALQERQNTQKEKELNDAKSQFFATMSHEFRTPLTAILGYSELAQAHDVSSIDKDKHIKTIHQSAQHMLRLINDILDLSKIEAQKLELESMLVDVVGLCNDVESFTRVLATQKNIGFETQYVFPLPGKINTDPTRLKQILVNLCSNAIKFTDQGGVILRVHCELSKETVFFTIIDTGVGIRKEQQEKLFAAFSQADSSTSRHFGGTGLGLYLSKVIANQLGGDITIESEYGKGSTFTLSLKTGDLSDVSLIHDRAPIHSDEHLVVENTRSRAGLHTERNCDTAPQKRVLVVDDNLVNIKLIEVHLTRMDVDVTCVNDGVEALTAILTGDFHVVFMDINMPVMDGVTAVKLLREKGIKIPIYAITGSMEEESVKQFLSDGFNGCLPKPFDLDKIKAAL